MHFDAAWKGDCLHIKTVKASWSQLLGVWSRAEHYGFFFKDIEVLSIWVSSTNFYGSQEFEIFDDVEEHEYTTTMMVELIKNYYFMIEYHPRRENVVANALSYKNRVVTIILEDCNERGLL